jgi:hypothetical protein
VEPRFAQRLAVAVYRCGHVRFGSVADALYVLSVVRLVPLADMAWEICDAKHDVRRSCIRSHTIIMLSGASDHRQRHPPASKSGVPRRVDAVAAYDPRDASGYQKAHLAQRSTNVYATLDAY